MKNCHRRFGVLIALTVLCCFVSVATAGTTYSFGVLSRAKERYMLQTGKWPRPKKKPKRKDPKRFEKLDAWIKRQHFYKPKIIGGNSQPRLPNEIPENP